jgi:hypothetical protein
MSNNLKSIGTIVMLVCMLGLAACGSSAPTSTPTLDLNPFRTEVAATVLAQVTQALAQTPSATAVPSSTTTTEPTSTPAPESSATPTVTATLATGTPGAGTVDRAQWVSQTVEDDTSFAPGETFTMTWSIKNVGTSTWTTNYVLRFFSGNAFGAPKEIPLGKEVPPGDTIDITVKMTAPTTPGNYRSDWVLSNESRSNFKEPVFLKIKVPAPPTPTSTPTRTPTP